ncbi:MAG: hypothetical protein AB8I69_10975 [Anaerolineae bacterium]|jgi:hypothetical protein
MKRKVILVLVLVITLGAVPVLAQISAAHDLSWHVIGGGGGRMENGGHVLQGTVGQAVTGSMGSSGYTSCSGFWCGAESEYRVYLSLVLGN